ncbi:HNH endonuclease [Scytonema sp. PCC 10023]|uniref:HNH endonuclease n=1 Tax=Scytonema sp. PCC 10023 TaxID=1680591 RepID=UPI0039C5F0F5
MKLSDYAKSQGVSYRTAWNWWKQGIIKGRQLPTGTIPLQIEHIHPKSKGGSNRVSNLTLSCERCNTKKGTKSIDEFLKNDGSRLEKIKRQAKQPLKDAAAVNATRWELFRTLKNILPTTTGTGGQTVGNRTRLELPKQHAY